MVVHYTRYSCDTSNWKIMYEIHICAKIKDFTNAEKYNKPFEEREKEKVKNWEFLTTQQLLVEKAPIKN